MKKEMEKERKIERKRAGVDEREKSDEKRIGELFRESLR